VDFACSPSVEEGMSCSCTVLTTEMLCCLLLQIMMEQPLEKKSGVRYGPPGSKRCVQKPGLIDKSTLQAY